MFISSVLGVIFGLVDWTVIQPQHDILTDMNIVELFCQFFV